MTQFKVACKKFVMYDRNNVDIIKSSENKYYIY